MSGPGALAVVGANHRSASLGLRDALFIDDAEVGRFLTGLGHQALALSTCDRVEVWVWDHDGAEVRAAEAALMARVPDHAGLAGQFYTLTGDAALRHVFAVTAGLDSLVIGEPQVPGQVKAAARLARDAGTVGSDLDRILQAALGAAKRVRSETAIGEGPVSIAAAATQLARDLHGDLKDRTGLLAGAGDMGELVAESLLAAGLKRLEVTAPRLSRAEALARDLDAHVVPFDDFPEALGRADIVLSAIGARQVSISSDMARRALKARRRRPMFFVDCGVPGDIDPAVNRLDGAFLYDLADLEQVALKTRLEREHAASAAWEIVETEVTAFGRGRSARIAVPAITALRGTFEAARLDALTEAKGDAETATRLLINRLLHAPSETMKDVAADGHEWTEMERVLRRLFRLE